jgi:hypothetical protein
MHVGFRSSIRHPLYPGFPAVPAAGASGRCATLAGTFEELAHAARAGARAERAVFVLNRAGAPFLAERERDQLWEMFGTPTFALLLDGDNRVVAYECELQRGLHIAAGPAPAGELETEPCECGRPGPRLFIAPGCDARFRRSPALRP